jgi:excisionase family DNA binding protein
MSLRVGNISKGAIMNEYWSTQDLADASGLTRQRIRQLLASGRIKGFKVGRDWVIPREEAQRWLRERGMEGGDND